MTTLQGRHPLVSLRTRSRQPASLLSVVLIAAVTLAAAVALAFAFEDGGPSGPVSSQVAAEPAPAPSGGERAGVLTPRVTETPLPAAPSVPGQRYDGGPEEGSAFAGARP